MLAAVKAGGFVPDASRSGMVHPEKVPQMPGTPSNLAGFRQSQQFDADADDEGRGADSPGSRLDDGLGARKTGTEDRGDRVTAAASFCNQKAWKIASMMLTFQRPAKKQVYRALLLRSKMWRKCLMLSSLKRLPSILLTWRRLWLIAAEDKVSSSVVVRSRRPIAQSLSCKVFGAADASTFDRVKSVKVCSLVPADAKT